MYLSDNCNLSIKESEIFLRSELDGYVKSLDAKTPQINTRYYFVLFNKIRGKIRVRLRLKVFISRILYRGCDSRIYKEHYKDYENIKKVVVSFNLTQKELNQSRRELSKLI